MGGCSLLVPPFFSFLLLASKQPLMALRHPLGNFSLARGRNKPLNTFFDSLNNRASAVHVSRSWAQTMTESEAGCLVPVLSAQ